MPLCKNNKEDILKRLRELKRNRNNQTNNNRQTRKKYNKEKKSIKRNKDKNVNCISIISHSPISKYLNILDIPHNITDKETINKYYKIKIRNVHADKTRNIKGGSDENNARDEIFKYYNF